MTLRTLLLAATALTGFHGVALADGMSFTPVAFAADDAAKHAVLASATVTFGGVAMPLAYHTILRTGDKLDDQVFGELLSEDGKSIGQTSQNPDLTSLLPIGKKLF